RSDSATDRTNEYFDDHGSILRPPYNGRVVHQIGMRRAGLDRKCPLASIATQKLKYVSGSTQTQEEIVLFVADTITVSNDLECQRLVCFESGQLRGQNGMGLGSVLDMPPVHAEIPYVE